MHGVRNSRVSRFAVCCVGYGPFALVWKTTPLSIEKGGTPPSRRRTPASQASMRAPAQCTDAMVDHKGRLARACVFIIVAHTHTHRLQT